jgi:D-hexose-6-phosphate mutarotase
MKKQAKNIFKYKDLITDIQRMWNVKVEVIPVTVRVMGTISNSLTQYLSNKPEKHEIKQPYWALHTYYRKY